MAKMTKPMAASDALLKANTIQAKARTTGLDARPATAADPTLTGSYDPTQDSSRAGTVPPASRSATPSLSSADRRTARRLKGMTMAAHASSRWKARYSRALVRWTIPAISADTGESRR
jgi:hypothetical protein